MTGKKENGYLTVYMALVLTVILSLFLSLFEGVRYNTIRMEAEWTKQRAGGVSQDTVCRL